MKNRKLEGNTYMLTCQKCGATWRVTTPNQVLLLQEHCPDCKVKNFRVEVSNGK